MCLEAGPTVCMMCLISLITDWQGITSLGYLVTAFLALSLQSFFSSFSTAVLSSKCLTTALEAIDSHLNEPKK